MCVDVVTFGVGRKYCILFSMSQLVADHISTAGIERAVTALSSYISNTRAQQDDNELLGWREEFVWLVISTKRMSRAQISKPRRMSGYWINYPCSTLTSIQP